MGRVGVLTLWRLRSRDAYQQSWMRFWGSTESLAIQCSRSVAQNGLRLGYVRAHVPSRRTNIQQHRPCCLAVPRGGVDCRSIGS